MKMRVYLLVSMVSGVWAGVPQASGEGAEDGGFVAADLDRDGKMERVTWLKFAETEDAGEFFQLRVLDDDGSPMWEGPMEKDTENPLVFGNWHFGERLPQLAADIDGDGSVELVVPGPQSDVSPTFYWVLRWTGEKFAPVRAGNLLEAPRGSGNYPWAKSEEWQGTWVQSFEGVNADGTFRVKMVEYLPDAALRMGEAHVTGDAAGFRVAKWVAPLAPIEEDAPEPGGGVVAGGGVAYVARLGRGDHFNSAGVRLESVAEILRQDRANYHNGKGDAEDGADPVFGTRQAREGMDVRRPVPVGVTEAGLREAIVKGTPLVEVEVLPAALRVRLVAR